MKVTVEIEKRIGSTIGTNFLACVHSFDNYPDVCVYAYGETASEAEKEALGLYAEKIRACNTKVIHTYDIDI